METFSKLILFNPRIKKKTPWELFLAIERYIQSKTYYQTSQFSTRLFAQLSRKRAESIRVLSNVWWYLLQNYSNHLCFSQSNLRRHLLVSSPLVVSSRDREKRFIPQRDEEREEEGKNNHTGQSVAPLTVEKWIPTFTNRSWSRITRAATWLEGAELY